jgi:hypothetical protein
MAMTTAWLLRRHPAARLLSAASAAVLFIVLTSAGVQAHGPDPTLSGGAFQQNQDLRFAWRPGAVPTSAIKQAIKAAAADVGASRASKAATFSHDADGPNLIGYGSGATCGVNGLACFTRTAPTGFTMWLREQGHVFDWGTLRWCQAYSTAPNGCYDAETISLDEFGHVEGLDHHLNYADGSDYDDAVVQTFSRTKPTAGWNRHTFGVCDKATLQRQYDMLAWTARYSTCLDLSTELDLATSATVVPVGGSVTVTATLRVKDLATYVRLGGNPISGRSVTLQRRAPGTTPWTTVGTMSTGAAAGTYVSTQKVSADVEFRTIFRSPTDEGLAGATSDVVRVSMKACNFLAPVGGTDAICI